MKIHITSEEMYPVFVIDDDPDSDCEMVEVPDDVVEEWSRAREQFERCQSEMRKIYEKAYGSFY